MFQREAAAKIGISIASLSKWECGVTKPSHRMTSVIQKFLNSRLLQLQKPDYLSAKFAESVEIARSIVFSKKPVNFIKTKVQIIPTAPAGIISPSVRVLKPFPVSLTLVPMGYKQSVSLKGYEL